MRKYQPGRVCGIFEEFFLKKNEFYQEYYEGL